MTKKKPGAVMGRPKGSGKGLDVVMSVALSVEQAQAIDAEVAASGTDRSAVLRGIVERWVKRRRPRG